MSQKLLKPAVVPQGITMKPVFNGVLFFKKIKIELCSDGIKGDVGLLNTPKEFVGKNAYVVICKGDIK